MSAWTVPPMWAGKTVFILASGPSMCEDTAAQVATTLCPTIVINTTVKLAPWADMLFAADERWWKHRTNQKDIGKFGGLKVSVEECGREDVLLLKSSGKIGFDPDPSCVRTGGNSGYSAIHVAVHAGAKRICLLGYDMREDGTTMHWHGTHPEPLRNASGGVFLGWLLYYQSLVAPLAERGVEVINCTPGSALQCWPCKPLAEVVL